jgi:hypothetical protein
MLRREARKLNLETIPVVQMEDENSFILRVSS